MFNEAWAWILFNVFIIGLLILDLVVFHRKGHVIKMREALVTSAIWILLALLFNVGIYFTMGEEAALNFLAGYLVEKSLSIDNLFVFVIIFKYFQTPQKHVHKVLFWGILGAIVMRAFFILVGIALVERFHWILYVFGVFLIYIGIKMALHMEKEIDLENNLLIRLFKKFMPVSTTQENGKFFVNISGIRHATPLFIALLTVESTDLIFALDSIPAIMAITLDPFIIYTSNIFAILGLRSLYFALAGILDLFYYLHYGLAAILIFIGTKMLISSYVKIPILYALLFIVLSIGISIVASLLFRPIAKNK